MVDREVKRRNKNLRWAIAVVVLLAAVTLGAFLIHSGNTNSWPETDCTVAGTRVVRADVADSGRAIVIYRGEYQLHYSVNGQDYFVWANSGWSDVDMQFVQDKVDARTDHCDFRVRYNLNHPSEAVAVYK